MKEVGVPESSVLLYQPEQPLGQEVDTEDDFQSSSSLQRLTELMVSGSHLGLFCFFLRFVRHCIESRIELEQELQKAFVPQLIPEKQTGILILSSSAPLVQPLPSLGRRKEGGWRGVAGGKGEKGTGGRSCTHARVRVTLQGKQ